MYLYRAQNVIWIWLGLAAVLSAVMYAFRPRLGLVATTDSHLLDVSRELLFAVGGILIATGVWVIHRAVEIMGHIFFATGALLNTIAVAILPIGTFGSHFIGVVTILGVAFASAFRAYFIIKWIGADVYTKHESSPSQ